jgi:hypothetical protein
MLDHAAEAVEMVQDCTRADLDTCSSDFRNPDWKAIKI